MSFLGHIANLGKRLVLGQVYSEYVCGRFFDSFYTTSSTI
jgi:hypothetical protein